MLIHNICRLLINVLACLHAVWRLFAAFGFATAIPPIASSRHFLFNANRHSHQRSKHVGLLLLRPINQQRGDHSS